MTFIINPHRFGAGAVTWDTYVASLSPYAWWKLDEDVYAVEGNQIIHDASGNNRTGTFAGQIVPARHQTALVTGSVYSVGSYGAGLRDDGTILDGLTAGSFTFGCWVQSTYTSSLSQWVMGGNYFWVGLNHDYTTGSAADGKITWLATTSGANADALTTADLNWNNNSPHLIMFEYDSGADTIDIYFDGSSAASRSHAGITMPTSHGTTDFQTGTGAAVLTDEYLFFDRLLTGTEHTTLASYSA